MGQVGIWGLNKILTFWASAENWECQALENVERLELDDCKFWIWVYQIKLASAMNLTDVINYASFSCLTL